MRLPVVSMYVYTSYINDSHVSLSVISTLHYDIQMFVYLLTESPEFFRILHTIKSGVRIQKSS